MRECSSCGVEKLASEFYARQSACKPCVIARTRRWQAKNAERFRYLSERWRREHGMKPRYKRVTKGGPCCRLRDRPAARVFTSGYCAECGVPYVARPGRTGHRFCSPLCRKRAGRTDLRHRQRAQRAGLRVSRLGVFERDGWTCRLCGKPLDRAARAPDPWAATLDHVVPLALGGAHVESNVQAAHFICNSRKGERVVQLAWAV